MADTKISDLTAVVTPALTDQFAVNQGGVSKKVTLQQLAGAAGSFSPVGTSRLSRTDATNLALGVGVVPLLVNSIWQTRSIASALSITNGSLSANTLYYVYVFDDSGTSTLELSTTGHSPDTAFGVETKTGDTTRTLVGMVRVDASSEFVYSAENKAVASWFNRKLISSTKLVVSQRTTSSTTVVEMSTADRAFFLSWADEVVIGHIVATASNDGAAGNQIVMQPMLDGIAQSQPIDISSGSTSFHINLSTLFNDHVVEGYHSISIGLACPQATNVNLFNGNSGTLVTTHI